MIDPLANCYLIPRSPGSLRPGELTGKRRRSSPRFDDNQDTLEKLARCAPPNYLHKHHLVEAERMRVLEGQSDAIMHHYDQAIALARENEFIHEEALADELAARYLLNQGQNDAAQNLPALSIGEVRSLGSKTEGRAS